MKNFIDRFVSLREEAGGGDGGGTGAGAGGGVDVAALQKELADTKTARAALEKELGTTKQTVAEKEQAVQFWHGKATAKPEPAAAAAEPGDDVDLLDVLGTKGAKGLDQVLKARGYVSEADVRGLISQTVDQVSREGKAVERFPELKDQSSDLFKLTKQNVAALAKDGIKGVAATEIAAERAYLQLVDEGKLEPKSVRDAKARAAAEEGGVDEDENDRIARANAAGGTTGRRTTKPANREAQETAEEKQLVNRIAAAFEITPEAYRKRAHDVGVNIGR